MSKKILGWILLALGLIIIIWGLFASYKIFTGKQGPPTVFSFSESKQKVEQETAQTQKEIMQQQIQKTLKESLGGLLSGKGLTKMFNLAVWSIFMFILFMGGGKISSIGIKIIKE